MRGSITCPRTDISYLLGYVLFAFEFYFPGWNIETLHGHNKSVRSEKCFKSATNDQKLVTQIRTDSRTRRLSSTLGRVGSTLEREDTACF